MNDGIPYFPFDVHLDDKFELMEAEFGLVGFAVVVKLLQRIYGGAGYFCEWTPDVVLLFCKNSAVEGTLVDKIVKAALRRGIFEMALFDRYHILTSNGIQKRYFSAISRRKEIELHREYLLLDVEAICKNVHITYKNEDKTEENADKDKQRKEKKRREQKSTQEETPSAKGVGSPLKEYGFSEKLSAAVGKWIQYKRERGEAYKQTGLQSLLKTIQKKADEYGSDTVAALIEECMSNNWKGIIWDRMKVKNQPEIQGTGSYDYEEIERRMWDRIKEG